MDCKLNFLIQETYRLNNARLLFVKKTHMARSQGFILSKPLLRLYDLIIQLRVYVHMYQTLSIC